MVAFCEFSIDNAIELYTAKQISTQYQKKKKKELCACL